MAETQASRRGFDVGGQGGVEDDWFETRETLAFDRHAFALGDFGEEVGKPPFCGLQALFVRVAQVDGQGREARNDVDDVGLEADRAGGRQRGFRRCTDHDFAEKGDDGRRHIARVVAHPGGRGAGMVGDAAHGDLLPGNALQVVDDTDQLTFGFEDRALLNVQFQIFARQDGARFEIARVADARKFVAQPGAVRANQVECDFHGQSAGVDERSRHVRLIAYAFLVGECGDDD